MRQNFFCVWGGVSDPRPLPHSRGNTPCQSLGVFAPVPICQGRSDPRRCKRSNFSFRCFVLKIFCIFSKFSPKWHLRPNLGGNSWPGGSKLEKNLCSAGSCFPSQTPPSCSMSSLLQNDAFTCPEARLGPISRTPPHVNAAIHVASAAHPMPLFWNIPLDPQAAGFDCQKGGHWMWKGEFHSRMGHRAFPGTPGSGCLQ